MEGLLSLLSILSKAHFEYLHWVNAFLRLSIEDRVSLETPSPLKGMHKQLSMLIPTPPNLTQPNLPTHLGQPNSSTQFFAGSEHAHVTS